MHVRIARHTNQLDVVVVFYLGDPGAVRTAVDRCAAPVVASANPHWDQHGAVTVLDPDGFHVVLSPDTWT